MKELRLAHLYPELLNLYGDNGNIEILKKRMEWRGYTLSVTPVISGDVFDDGRYDMVYIGGGADAQQRMLLDDFHKNKVEGLRNAVVSGKSVLAICGGYQLLGHDYRTMQGEVLDFSHILDFHTVSSHPRCNGDIIIKVGEDIFTGYENHSGHTFLGDSLNPFGHVIHGFGNNGVDLSEGVHFKNTIGTYCHGPLLSENPELADMFILTVMNQKYGIDELKRIDDEYMKRARDVILHRYHDDL